MKTRNSYKQEVIVLAKLQNHCSMPGVHNIRSIMWIQFSVPSLKKNRRSNFAFVFLRNYNRVRIFNNDLQIILHGSHR